MGISPDKDAVGPTDDPGPDEPIPPLSRHALRSRDAGDAPTAPDSDAAKGSASDAGKAPEPESDAAKAPGPDAAKAPGPKSAKAPAREPMPEPLPGLTTPGAAEPLHAAAEETFWNLPNSITMLRAAVVPVLLLYPFFPGESGSTVMAWFFIVAAVSDLLDGWLARRGQQVTHIGKLLDPLADKLLVATALIVLVATPGRIPSWALWMVVTIVGRELAVTGLRGIASAGGQVVAASGLGKLKTVTQNIAIGALLFHHTTLGLDANAVGLAFLFVATALTIASGYRYFADYFRALADAGR